MKITKEVVADCLAEAQDGRHAARAVARSKGYKFGNAHFDALANEVRDSVDQKNHTENTPRQPLVAGQLRSPESRRVKTSARTLVFTCAQNNTLLHDAFWQALMNFCDYKNAE